MTRPDSLHVQALRAATAGAPSKLLNTHGIFDSAAAYDRYVRSMRGASEELSPFNASQIRNSREWLQLFAHPLRTVRPRQNSYRLKHDVEYWADVMRPKEGSYVTNGAFIVAALLEGYRWRIINGGPNCIFALGKTFDRDEWWGEAAQRKRAVLGVLDQIQFRSA